MAPNLNLLILVIIVNVVLIVNAAETAKEIGKKSCSPSQGIIVDSQVKKYDKPEDVIADLKADDKCKNAKYFQIADDKGASCCTGADFKPEDAAEDDASTLYQLVTTPPNTQTTQTKSTKSSTTDTVSDRRKNQEKIYEGLIMGLGVGSFVILIFALVGIILCFIKDAFAYPNCTACCGFMIPAFVFLLIYIWPKESLSGVDKTDEDALPTDFYFVKILLFFIVTILVLIIACCSLLCFKWKFIYAQRMGSDDIETSELPEVGAKKAERKEKDKQDKQQDEDQDQNQDKDKDDGEFEMEDAASQNDKFSDKYSDRYSDKKEGGEWCDENEDINYQSELIDCELLGQSSYFVSRRQNTRLNNQIKRGQHQYVFDQESEPFQFR